MRIPSGPALQPVIEIGEAFQTRNIQIASGASLTNKGTLTVAGNISSSVAAINNIDAGIVRGSVQMEALCGKSSPVFKGNVFAGNAVKNFKINGDFSISSSPAEGLRVSGEFGFVSTASNKTFNSGNNVVLVSTANATANVVATLNNNLYNGEFTVERFIPARRSWRLLTAPLSSTATTTISQAWQDGQQATTIPPPAYTAGSGTHITNGTTAANGFDKGSTNSPSIRFYNGTVWATPANTNVLPIKTHPGYMLFVRGDRNISIAGTWVTANTTTLRPKGNIHTGTSPVASAAAGFKVVGNPYPSAINFHNTVKTGLADAYYLWDPRVGGALGVGAFVTFAWNSVNNNYDRTVAVGGASLLPTNGTIESGAAFVVNFTGAGSLTINETDKISTSAAGPFGRPVLPSVVEGRLQANLGFTDTDGSFAPLDGTLVTFHSSYNSDVTAEDAVKINNVNEELAISKTGKMIAIERRLPVEKNDTIFFAFNKPKFRTYQLQLIPVNLAKPGLSAFISDSLTGLLTEVSTTDTAYYSFAVTNNDPASYAKGRLQLIFKTNSVSPSQNSFVQLTAVEQGSGIALQWQVTNDHFVENYIVERSLNGIDFTMATDLFSNGSAAYHWLDANPSQGNNFYRIKKTGTNGEVEYSNVVSIRIGKTKHWVHIYPNPVTEGNCTVQVNNKTAGRYKVKLINNAGQIVYTTHILHPGGQSNQQLSLPVNIAAGEYQVELVCMADRHSDIIPLLIKRK